MATTIITQNNFFPGGKALRAQFDERFADPRSANPERFIWDYWHVPGQYTVLRTPAYHFFEKKLYENLHQQIAWWGRRNLGCHDISPPWMSCYVEGCHQELHGDLPHGPWAFVYSLTPWKTRKFSGGQTMLLKEGVLRHWQSAQSGKGLEREDIFEEIEPFFNRLTVFDPRIPHGVREVRGVRDVTQGRLVIHGWFVQPRPFIEGPLQTRVLQSAIDGMGEFLNQRFADGLDVQGMTSLNFRVANDGSVLQPKVLANSLRFAFGDENQEKALSRALTRDLCRFWQEVRFGKQKGPSQVTLPVIFETN